MRLNQRLSNVLNSFAAAFEACFGPLPKGSHPPCPEPPPEPCWGPELLAVLAQAQFGDPILPEKAMPPPRDMGKALGEARGHYLLRFEAHREQ